MWGSYSLFFFTRQTQEIEVLRDGGDLKLTLQERDRTIDSLHERLTEATHGLSAVKQVVTLLASRAQYEVSILKAKNDAIKQFVNETLMTKMKSMMAESANLISSRAATVVDDATKILLAKYRYEVQQRKLLFNKLQEVKGMNMCWFVLRDRLFTLYGHSLWC